MTSILADLQPEDLEDRKPIVRNGRPIATWLEPKDHARYLEIQRHTNKKFSKKLRQIVLVAIDEAEKKLGLV